MTIGLRASSDSSNFLGAAGFGKERGSNNRGHQYADGSVVVPGSACGKAVHGLVEEFVLQHGRTVSLLCCDINEEDGVGAAVVVKSPLAAPLCVRVCRVVLNSASRPLCKIVLRFKKI